jgi:sugar lactone lactonase YvrE
LLNGNYKDSSIVPIEETASEQVKGVLEPVHYFNGAMPTGVTVSHHGRIFVNFPKWGDQVVSSVAEIFKGHLSAYPGEALNHYTSADLSAAFVSVQSVVVDPKDRLWVLDTGSPFFQPTKYGGPKLIGVDLKTNQVFKKILFAQEVALPTTYLNDIRFDLRRGDEGIAYITDSSPNGPNGIIVVDVSSGKGWRKLDDHPSTRPESLETFSSNCRRKTIRHPSARWIN